MNKYCPRCGVVTKPNAAFCQNCGAKLPQEPPPVSNVYQQTNIPVPPQQPNQAQFIIVQQISSKIKNAAIFWMVWGILCAIISIVTICVGAVLNSTYIISLYNYYHGGNPGAGTIVYGVFSLMVSIMNIVYSMIHFGYAKEIFVNPTAIIRKIDSPALYIVSIIVNIIFGGILGIIGGVIMLNTRALARGNQFVFQGGCAPQNPVPPYAPPPQSVTPPEPQVQYQQPSVRQSAPVQQKQNVQVQTEQEASVTAEQHEGVNLNQNNKQE